MKFLTTKTNNHKSTHGLPTGRDASDGELCLWTSQRRLWVAFQSSKFGGPMVPWWVGGVDVYLCVPKRMGQVEKQRSGRASEGILQKKMMCVALFQGIPRLVKD